MKCLIAPLLFALAFPAFAAPVRVLVVSGDPQRTAPLSEALTKGGATVDTTAAAPTAAQLAETDVLLLCGPEPEGIREKAAEAVAAFTRRGGGIVALGGGIGEGGWMKPLAGFTSTPASRKFPNRLMLYAVTDAHPITRDASPFDIEDQTFYDLELDKGIIVLASAFTPKVTAKRIDPRSPEKLDRANVYDLQPQMWTFEGADKHRAFTLLQASAASLQHPSIRSFVLRGIAWTARRGNVDELCAKEDLSVLRYPPGGPSAPADTVKSFEMQPGFTARVVASEPLINKAIAMQWDGRGRLWVAETPEYPNGRRPAIAEPWRETGVLKPGNYDRPATDRISILTDSDGDGIMDKKTVFHEGLELITGFCLYGDGVVAVGQPDIVFLHDADGDDKADRVERLYSGFTPGDTHFVANHFMVAPDGWIYANTGSGADAVAVANPAVSGKVSSGIFRFKPDGSAIEQVGSKGGNAFGLDIASDGELFFGQATSGNPVQHVVLPEPVLAKGKVGNTGSVESVIRGRKVLRSDMPDRSPFMQIDAVGGYSSACASTLMEGGAWPAEYEGTIFCTEPILDIIHCEKLVAEGPAFTGKIVPKDKEWLRARDFWFFPIDIQFGPDGAMYVLDFYNPIVAHSDSRGPQHSRSGATTRPDREHYFGRIYRIQHEQAKKLEVPDLTKLDPSQLVVRAFRHPNKGVRFTAHRLLLDRKDAADAFPVLTGMALAETFTPARILALWALHRLGMLNDDILASALRPAADADVKKAALLIIEARGPKNTVNFVRMLNDADPRVRLLALRAMSASALTSASAATLLTAMPSLQDNWSKSAAVAAASSNPVPVLEAALASTAAPGGALLDLTSSLAAVIIDRKDSAGLARIIAAAADAPASSAPLVRTILNAAAARSVPPSGHVTASLQKLLASGDMEVAAGALPIAIAWDQDGTLQPAIAGRIASFLTLISDAKQPDATRASAIRSLTRSRAADPKILPAVTALLLTSAGESLLLDIIAALSATGESSLGKPLVAAWANIPPPAQTALFDALASRAEWSAAVLDALESKVLKPTQLGPPRISKLRLHPDAATAARARKLMETLGSAANPQKAEVIAKLLPLIEGKSGDAAKGKLAYTSLCATCHKLNGEGKEVGPPLDGIGVHGTAELLTHIIDPSRVVDNEHRTWSIALKDGTFAVGIVGRENAQSLTLRLAGGIEQEIKTADIKSRQDTGLSLMPEGLEALGDETLRDILTHLAGDSGKYRALNLGNAFTTDTNEGLYHAREQKNDSIPPARYGVVTVEKVPFSLPDPATTPSGGNVIVLKNADGQDFAARLPQRVEIPVGFAASKLHFLSGVAGWGGGAEFKRPAMKVTIVHTDGKEEIIELNTGETFIDYVSGEDVPGSKRIEGVVKRHHIRYFALPVKQTAPVKTLILESYNNGISPTTLAITADTSPGSQ